MKRIVLIAALLGFGLICMQQRSYADKKMSHAEYAKSPIKDCNECHKGEGIAPNHGADFVREHRVLAGKADKNCNQCHDQAWCLDCHQGGGNGDTCQSATPAVTTNPRAIAATSSASIR